MGEKIDSESVYVLPEAPGKPYGHPRKRQKGRYIPTTTTLTKYGMTLSEFNARMEEQCFKCAICQDSLRSNKPHIDHCHRRGTVRGLLCVRCNHGLGAFRDRKKFLKTAIAYLKRGRKCKT